MIRGRVKQVVIAAGASALVAVATLAVVPSVASAVGSQGTTTAVTAKPSGTVTGNPVLLTAKVSPVSGDVGVPTGRVTFTVTGSNASTVNCKKSKNTVKIDHKGKAQCHILPGLLLAAASPYTVSASYSGDGSFAGSNGSTSVTVGKVKTATALKVAPFPHNGTADAVTATVTTAHGGSLLTGSVLFSVSATPSTPNLKRTCTGPGGDSQPLAVSGNVGIAVCHLRSGWFTVPKKNKANPKPEGTWNVSASYSGDGSYKASVGTKSGTAKS